MFSYSLETGIALVGEVPFSVIPKIKLCVNGSYREIRPINKIGNSITDAHEQALDDYFAGFCPIFAQQVRERSQLIL